MTENFEIIKIINHHNRGLFIFARLINYNPNFVAKDGSKLGGIPVFHYKEMSKDNEESNLPLDVFVFRPIDLNILSISSFSEGHLVEFVEPS